jgi:hypothetical protein
MAPGHASLLQRQIPKPTADARRAGAKARLLLGEVQAEAMAFENEHGENIQNFKLNTRGKITA